MIIKQTLLIALILLIVQSGFGQTRKFSSGPDYKKEIDSLTNLIQKEPDNAELYFQRSNMIFLYNSNFPNQTISFKMDGAINDINKAIELKSDNSDFYLQRAVIYEFQDSLDLALTDYTKAIELKPNDGVCYIKTEEQFM